ncbi:hypothetical protein BDW02DRAFT_613478 [Decorospora gaudefroyi]|uniref:Uncharacterized protein n=1 Tax=Decorospora gaudefroyi TaxID=184978 RepID=A0A6A5JWI5_9PLEO|nr:hypothetical protein BDW02DRAFT_613478 [Decorospora gaudefroyi]
MSGSCGSYRYPRGQLNLQASTSAISASALAIPATTLTTLTTHALGRWLALQLLLQAARLYVALLPLALNPRKPGYSGDVVGRYLPPSPVNRHLPRPRRSPPPPPPSSHAFVVGHI